jgi:excisionase family DNA binding protein
MLTPHDIQKFLNIGRCKAYALLKTGEIRSIRVGQKYRIPKTYLRDFIKRNN